MSCIQITYQTVPLKYYDEYVNFVNTFSKVYENDLEYEKSYTNFVKSYEHVKNHSDPYFTVAVNFIADQEVPVNKVMKDNSKKRNLWDLTYIYDMVQGPMPDEWDWTESIPIRTVDQSRCGSCWSFSAIGSLESAYFLKHGKYLNFSESQLVDCSKAYGNAGCNGGEMDFAFKYLEKYGFETESSYPYVPRDQLCSYDKSKVIGKVKSFVDVAPGVNNIKRALVTHGPLSIGIDASAWSFQLYHGGVYTNKECSNTELDHGVLLVGYGEEDGVEYWKVRNSWGNLWGMSGYFLINMEHDCGISENLASYPVL